MMKSTYLAPWPLLSWDSARTLTSSFLALLWSHPPKAPGSQVDFLEDTTGNQKGKLHHVP